MVSDVIDTCNPRVTSALPAFKVGVEERQRWGPSPFLYKGKLKIILDVTFTEQLQDDGTF